MSGRSVDSWRVGARIVAAAGICVAIGAQVHAAPVIPGAKTFTIVPCGRNHQKRLAVVPGKTPFDDVRLVGLDGDKIVSDNKVNFIEASIVLFLCKGQTPPTAQRLVADVGVDALQEFTLGREPVDVTGVDLNGDDHQDVAVANRLSHEVSVLLANADGGLNPPVEYPTGGNPVAIASGDFDGDAIPDLVTADSRFDAFGLSVLAGNSDGSVDLPVTVATSDVPLDVTVALLDAGDDADLAFATVNGGVQVALGNGNGTFQGPVTVADGGASSVAALDMNGDGHVDLLSNRAIVPGNGNGTFDVPIVYANGFLPAAAISADLNNDGISDVAAINSQMGAVNVLVGNGDGTLRDAFHYAVGSSVEAVEVVDANQDGNADLLISNFSDDHNTLAYGRGDGTFPGTRLYLANTSPDNAILADFDGDGTDDLFVSSALNRDGVVLEGLGMGVFGPQIAVPGAQGTAIGAADFDGDGKVDVALVNDPSGGERIAVHAGNGNFTFDPPGNLALPDDDTRNFVLARDLNDDDDVDLVSVNNGTGNLSVFLGNGAGGFAPRADIGLGIAPANQRGWLADGDFNEDGDLDLAVVGAGDFGAESGGVVIALGNGAGGFAVSAPLLADTEPTSAVTDDFDEDGNLDLAVFYSVVGPSFETSIRLLPGNGNGTFGTPTTLVLDYFSAGAPLAVDYTVDGFVDLVFVLEDKLAVMAGNGDGTFDAPVRFDAGEALARTVVRDLNRDGRPDVIVPNIIHTGSVAVVINDSAAPLPQPVSAVLPGSRAVTLGSGAATVFATVINPAAESMTHCDIAPTANLPIDFLFQTTNPATNALTGTANTPVDIPAGAAQSFLLALTPTAAFPPTTIEFAFACDGVLPAAPIPGVNVLVLSARTSPGPDIIALAASGLPGRVELEPAGAFVVATANIGAPASVSVRADTGGTTLPLVLSWCQTNPTTSVCLSPPTTAPLAVTIGAGATPTFGVFATATGPIALDPAANRIVFRIQDAGGGLIGSTSVAVSAP